MKTEYPWCSGMRKVRGALSRSFLVASVLCMAAMAGFSSANGMPVGEVVAWGGNGSGQTTIPSGLSNVVAIAAGDSHSLALTADGRVVGWGWNGYGQTNIPSGLRNVVAIAAGSGHSLALSADGRVGRLGGQHLRPNDHRQWVGHRGGPVSQSGADR